MTQGLSQGAHAFGVLADATRRRVVEQLADTPAAVNELARALPVTRPAVSQHLRVLKDAGLVTETALGTRRIYRLDPAGLEAMRQWLDGLWAQGVANFAALADGEAEDEPF